MKGYLVPAAGVLTVLLVLFLGTDCWGGELEQATVLILERDISTMVSSTTDSNGRVSTSSRRRRIVVARTEDGDVLEFEVSLRVYGSVEIDQWTAATWRKGKWTGYRWVRILYP